LNHADVADEAEKGGLLLLAHEHIAPDSAFSCCYLGVKPRRANGLE
jgi:hypothetical protein